MAAARNLRIPHRLRSVGTIAGIVALSVMMTLLTQRWLAPTQAEAQTTPGIVQGTEFDLMGTNGAVVARLKPDTSGTGELVLFDSTGHQRILVSAAQVAAFEASGSVQSVMFDASPTIPH